jgi:hypothetical protein
MTAACPYVPELESVERGLMFDHVAIDVQPPHRQQTR